MRWVLQRACACVAIQCASYADITRLPRSALLLQNHFFTQPIMPLHTSAHKGSNVCIIMHVVSLWDSVLLDDPCPCNDSASP